MRTIETTVYKFNELSEQGKERAIENLCDINVNYQDWFDSCYDDAKRIGLKITEFDTYRGTIKGQLNQYAYDTAIAIINEHGEQCDTHKLAKQFEKDWIALVAKFSDGIKTDTVMPEKDDEFDLEAKELENEFEKDLLQDYLVMLRNEYEYMTSKEAIIETIEANEYEFTEDGKLI